MLLLEVRCLAEPTLLGLARRQSSLLIDFDLRTPVRDGASWSSLCGKLHV